jgi:hypothetical protein
MSFVEAVTNIVVGYGLAVLTQIIVFPIFGFHVSVSDNLLLGSVFTIVSLARGYALRRLFNTLHGRQQPPDLLKSANSHPQSSCGSGGPA